jgi:hypothetical protein
MGEILDEVDQSPARLARVQQAVNARQQGGGQTSDSAGTNLWTQNAISFRCEERVALGVARPTAVNIVTGLPSS